MKFSRSFILLQKPGPVASRTFIGVKNGHPSSSLQFQDGNKAAYAYQRPGTHASYACRGSAGGTLLRQCPTSNCHSQHLRFFSTGTPHYHASSHKIGQPAIHSIFENGTGTLQYVVADPSTSCAVIIDPVLNFDPATRVITSEAADLLLSLIKRHNYKVDRILETHIHADHLTAASYLQNRLVVEQDQRPLIGIGKRIKQVQDLFGQRYSVPAAELEGVFDHLFEDDEIFHIGNLNAQAVHLPGHTPDHLGYKIGDNVFCGDSVFHADIGTARCDFPGGSAERLYNSGRKLLKLPDHIKLWTGHDYPPKGRSDPVPWLTIQEQRKRNIHLMEGTTDTMFMALRHERDAKLREPKLLHQSLQMNIRAGRLPKPSELGHRMLHLPLNLECQEW